MPLQPRCIGTAKSGCSVSFFFLWVSDKFLKGESTPHPNGWMMNWRRIDVEDNGALQRARRRLVLLSLTFLLRKHHPNPFRHKWLKKDYVTYHVFLRGSDSKGETRKCEERSLLKSVCVLRCVFYPTGSMQQLLNGRAALPDLYMQGRGFAPVQGKKWLPPFGNAPQIYFMQSYLNKVIIKNLQHALSKDYIDWLYSCYRSQDKDFTHVWENII